MTLACMAIQGPVSMSNLLELKSIIHGEFLYLLAAMRKLILRRVVILQHAKMVDWKISPIVTNEDEPLFDKPEHICFCVTRKAFSLD